MEPRQLQRRDAEGGSPGPRAGARMRRMFSSVFIPFVAYSVSVVT